MGEERLTKRVWQAERGRSSDGKTTGKEGWPE